MDSKLQSEPARDSEPGRHAGDRDAIIVISSERPAAEVEFGSGWYHAAAIEESQQAHARQR